MPVVVVVFAGSCTAVNATANKFGINVPIALAVVTFISHPHGLNECRPATNNSEREREREKKRETC